MINFKSDGAYLLIDYRSSCFEVLKVIANNPGITQREIGQKVPLEQSTISNITIKLLHGNLISYTKKGHFHHYNINMKELKEYMEILQSLILDSEVSQNARVNVQGKLFNI